MYFKLLLVNRLPLKLIGDIHSHPMGKLCLYIFFQESSSVQPDKDAVRKGSLPGLNLLYFRYSNNDSENSVVHTSTMIEDTRYSEYQYSTYNLELLMLIGTYLISNV